MRNLFGALGEPFLRRQRGGKLFLAHAEAARQYAIQVTGAMLLGSDPPYQIEAGQEVST